MPQLNHNTDDITSRLATIETIVTRLETRLLGNGQPGELDRLHSRANDLDTRLDSVEKTEARAKGAFWSISALIGMLTGGELLHMLGLGKR